MTHLTSRSFRLSGWPDILRLRGSVIPNIALPVLVMAMLSATVCYIDMDIRDLGLPNSITPTLSVVVGLLLVFRNTTSYDRWWEGRKLFQDMIWSTRTLAMHIWVGIPSNTKGSGIEDIDTTETPLEDKINVLRLMMAYVASCKRHLRREYGIHYPDIEPYLPRSFMPASVMPISGQNLYNSSYNERTPLLSEIENQTKIRSRFSRISRMSTSTAFSLSYLLSGCPSPIAPSPKMSLPLEIAFRISLYIANQRRQGRIDSPQNTLLTTALNAMTQSFSNMERIEATPIPHAYTIHLKQCVFLYCITLPFVLVNDLKWWTVLVVSMVSFTLFGIEGIGSELENPFGHDANDLNLDGFCEDLKNELEYIINGGVPIRSESNPLDESLHTRNLS